MNSDLYYDESDYYERLERIEAAEQQDYEDAMLDAQEAQRDLDRELDDEYIDWLASEDFDYDDRAGW